MPYYYAAFEGVGDEWASPFFENNGLLISATVLSPQSSSERTPPVLTLWSHVLNTHFLLIEQRAKAFMIAGYDKMELKDSHSAMTHICVHRSILLTG